MIAILILCLSTSVESSAQNKSYPFKPGEKLTYNMKFGWFNVGEAVLWLDPEFHYPAGKSKPHYHLQFIVTTASWFKIFSKLSVCMETMVEAELLQPLRSDRDMEGKGSIDIRHDYFTYADSITVDAYIEDLDEWRHHSFVKGNVPVRDALSTYMWLRSRDRSQYVDPVEIRTFFSNDLYEFKMLAGSKTTYKYQGRKVRALEFGLDFPEGEYFESGKTGKVVMSNDANRFPLRLEIDMTVGSFVFDLQKVENMD